MVTDNAQANPTPEANTQTNGDGQTKIPSIGWLSRKCGLHVDYYDKAGSSVSVGKVLESIRNPVAKRRRQIAVVQQLKRDEMALPEGSAERKAAHDKVGEAKKKLPSMIYQGTLDGEDKSDEHFVEANGIYGLDFDGFANEGEAKDFKAALFCLEYIGAAWISGSKMGVHALAIGEITDTANGYTTAWSHLVADVKSRTKRDADPQRCNRNGILFGSFDPQVLWRVDVQPFVPKEHHRESETEKPKAKERSRPHSVATDSQLAEQLAHIPNNDLEYKDWQRVIYAIHSEVGEAGYAAARGWSESSFKHSDKEFDELWRNAKPQGRSKGAVTWGTLVTMAGGHNAKAQGGNTQGGRPRSDEPDRDSVVKRGIRAGERIGDRLLQVTPAEVRDAERIVAYCVDDLLLLKSAQGEEAYLVNAGGLWEPLEHRRTDRSTGALARLVAKARKRALDAGAAAGYAANDLDDIRVCWANGDSAKFKGNLARQIAQRVAGREVAVKVVHEQRMDDRSHASLLPLEGGGAWHIAQAKVIPASEVASHRMRERGWCMPLPVDNPGSLAADAVDTEIANRYSELFERIAALFIAPGKVVDVFTSAMSSWGKTTFFDMLREAFPGAVVCIDGRSAYNQSTMRFTPVAAATAHAAIVVVDGCGHIDHDLPPSVLDAHTDVMVTIELKGKDAKSVRRMGNIVLLGHDWPPIDVDAQGASTRLRWAHRVSPDATPLDQSRRDLLMSPAGIERFRWRFVSKMHELANADGGALKATETDASLEHRNEMIRERGCPMIAALKSHYVLQANGFVPTTDIEKLLTAVTDDGKPPAGKDLAAKMRRAFGNAVKRGTRMSGGERLRGWIGLGVHVVPF